MPHTTLINPQALLTHLTDTDWCLLDCRHDLMDVDAGRRAYETGHIPGARFAALETDLSGPKTGGNGRHPLPDRQTLIKQFARWGINQTTQIVAYDAQGGQFAARAWWLACWLGHANVAVLDGGWAAWLAVTQTISTQTPTQLEEGVFSEKPPLVQTVKAQAVAERGPNTVLVDARAPERYRGESEPIDPVAGHIPGAVNRFWQDNLADSSTQRFKSPAALKSEYEALLNGRTPDQMMVYCGSGISASHHCLAMAHAGLAPATLYAGSWSHWIADTRRPIALGGTQ